jgi:murein DD-endopeptidase MepM/ murein hydrolase activator NlpD
MRDAPEELRERYGRAERNTDRPSTARKALSHRKAREADIEDQIAHNDLRHLFSGTEEPARDMDAAPVSDNSDSGEYRGGAHNGEDLLPGNDTRARETREASNAAKRGPRLQFTAEETPGTPKSADSGTAKNARRHAEETGVKPERRVVAEKNDGTGKPHDGNGRRVKRRLVFEEEVRSRQERLKNLSGARPVKKIASAAAGYAHKKLHEVEQENVGVEAAHRAELQAEEGLRAFYRRRRRASSRRAGLPEKKARLHAKASVREAADMGPKPKGSVLSRMAQKRKIKRDYVKLAREKKKIKAAKKIAAAVRRHPAAILVICLIAFLLISLMTSFASCGNMIAGGMGTVMATSYLAPDADIDAAELAYTEWETDLQIEISKTEQTYPGFDEYRYSVGNIGHGPYELMAYLTAQYEDFSFPVVKATLRGIFGLQYHLAYTEEIEIHTRIVTKTDSLTGETYEEEESYEWRVLNVTLTTASFTDVVMPGLDAERMERYNLLTQVKGNRQYAGSPFSFNWLPYVSDGYGWRVHPISGIKNRHNGVDTSVRSGTEILAAHDGTVTFSGSSGDYGLAVMIAGEKGVETRYAHCSELLVSQGQSVKMGDVIAKVGSTGNSTGPHLHFEILKDGQYLNPLYFAVTNDDGSSAIPPGTPGGVVIPDYPGAPMDDARFAAVMEEAKKHLGKPYVFGASGPGSFDCSGFVSYVLSKSVYPGFGRTTAQGIYNISTPVARSGAQPGDLIFFTKTYNSGTPVTHIGIYIGNGKMIHAGNPVQYASIDTPYWTQHFYAFARLPV